MAKFVRMKDDAETTDEAETVTFACRRCLVPLHARQNLMTREVLWFATCRHGIDSVDDVVALDEHGNVDDSLVIRVTT